MFRLHAIGVPVVGLMGWSHLRRQIALLREAACGSSRSYGKTYICEDRTAPKFRDRFDINCDQDRRCPYQVAGRTSVKVLFE